MVCGGSRLGPPAASPIVMTSFMNPTEVLLSFELQQDGRIVSRLDSGKVVLLDFQDHAFVKPGESWYVTLTEKETYCVARAVRQADAEGVRVVSTPSTPRRKLGEVKRQPFLLHGMYMEPVNVIQKNERVAIFVDGANTDKSMEALGWRLDWKRTLEFFVPDTTFTGASYYTTDYLSNEDDRKAFHDFLSHSGFTVHTKPVVTIRDTETGEIRVKGNVDIELALDMVASSDTFDVAILFSGDNDYKRVLEILRNKGKRVYVVSTRTRLGREIGYIAHKPVWFLEDLKSVLELKEDAA